MTANLNKDLIRATTLEVIDCFTADRNARIESRGGVDFVMLDDVGEGEYSKTLGPIEAAELIRVGICRDAR